MDSKISVVIPTYKRRVEIIKKTIDSIVNQTHKNIEILLINDNGPGVYTNDIREFINENAHIKYIEHISNKGACAARNTGILNATSEYIAFLDDDDTWEKDKLKKQVSQFTNENIGLVYCGIRYHFEKSGKVICKKAKSKKKPARNLLIENYIGSTSCGMVRKSCALKVGMFDENLKSGQDLDFWIRLVNTFEVAFVEECLLNYTVYKENTITSNYNNRLESNIYLRKKYKEIFEYDIELKTIYTMKIIKAFFRLKKFDKAFIHFMKSLKYKEFSFKYFLKYYA